MAKKVLMATIVLLALSMMLISQGVACVGAISPAQPRKIPAIVSTGWLYNNLDLENLVVLDVRSAGEYVAGHILGAINVSEADWYVNDPFTVPLNTSWMELPPDEDLISLIENAGIKKDSLVVVVGNTSGPLSPMPLALYNVAGTTRVAITLLYAGIRNVAILDGGYDKWVKEYPDETEPGTVTPTPVKYRRSVDKKMVVSAEYVEKKIGKSVIVDARDYDVYCGGFEPWLYDYGHIPTAENLPTPWLWNIITDGGGTSAIYITYKDAEKLEEMASDVIGRNKHREVIVYCGVGGYASTMYFVLSEVLGYTNVKMYDGSAQEWTMLGKPVVICPP